MGNLVSTFKDLLTTPIKGPGPQSPSHTDTDTHPETSDPKFSTSDPQLPEIIKTLSYSQSPKIPQVDPIPSSPLPGPHPKTPSDDLSVRSDLSIWPDPLTSKQKIFIIGQTASGKTHTSLRIAKALDTEIINTDAIQVYKHANVMTATASAWEQDGVRHHLLSFLELTDLDFNVYKFLRALDPVLARGFESKIPVFVGGTHLYLEHLLYENLEQENLENDCLRKRGQEVFDSDDIQEMKDFLGEFSSGQEFLQKLTKNDNRRLKSGLGRFLQGGNLIEKRALIDNPKNLLLIYPVWDNEQNFRAQITDRVDKMIFRENGYLEIIKVFDLFIFEKFYNKDGTKVELKKFLTDDLDYFDGQKNVAQGYGDFFGRDQEFVMDLYGFFIFLKDVLVNTELQNKFFGKGVLQAIGYSEFFRLYQKITFETLSVNVIFPQNLNFSGAKLFLQSGPTKTFLD
jgi:tRNA dimethylallyltransferase